MATNVGARWDEDDVLRLSGVFQKLKEDTSDMKESGAWQAVSDVLSDEFETVFKKEGAHRGPRWSRLSPVTIKQRQEKNLTPIRIGWATGRMATSLIEPTHPEALEFRDTFTYLRGTSVRSNGVNYPSIFETGRRGQPPRPIIGRLFRRGNTRTTTRLVEAIEGRVFKSLKGDGSGR